MQHKKKIKIKTYSFSVFLLGGDKSYQKTPLVFPFRMPQFHLHKECLLGCNFFHVHTHFAVRKVGMEEEIVQSGNFLENIEKLK